MAQETFAHRLAPKIGEPVATLFAESGSDRRLVIEITVGAVAAYLGGKFLDGFIEGLGIKDAGKRLGERVKQAIADLSDLILDDLGGQNRVLDLEHQALILQEVARELVPYLDNEPARLQGE